LSVGMPASRGSSSWSCLGSADASTGTCKHGGQEGVMGVCRDEGGQPWTVQCQNSPSQQPQQCIGGTNCALYPATHASTTVSRRSRRDTNVHCHSRTHQGLEGGGGYAGQGLQQPLQLGCWDACQKGQQLLELLGVGGCKDGDLQAWGVQVGGWAEGSVERGAWGGQGGRAGGWVGGWEGGLGGRAGRWMGGRSGALRHCANKVLGMPGGGSCTAAYE
jgi:hypothetical protein